jgi:predicted RNase H-like HicB family nuclease
MNTKMTLIYWKGEKFWLGKLLENPEIMTQGESFEELEENIKDAYLTVPLKPQGQKAGRPRYSDLRP